MDLEATLNFESVTRALREAEITDDEFETALKWNIESLTSDEPPQCLPDTKRLKDIHVGLCSLFIEASKFAMTESAFEQSVKDATGVTQSKKLQALVCAYRDNMANIRLKIGEIDSSEVPLIVDSMASVNCRLTSTEVKKLNGAGCVVKLVTDRGQDNVQFHCTIQQLEDLVWSLRQATKVVEKHAQ